MKNEIILSVLEDVRNSLELSNSFLGLDTDSPFFNDSCLVVSARYKISRLIDAIKLSNEYVKD